MCEELQQNGDQPGGMSAGAKPAGMQGIVRCFVILLTTTAITSYAGPMVGAGNVPVNTEWASGSSQITRPDQSMSFAPALESTATSVLQSMPKRPPAPPLTYTPMYKCKSSERTTYQDTPCDRGVLYRTKGSASNPAY